MGLRVAIQKLTNLQEERFCGRVTILRVDVQGLHHEVIYGRRQSIDDLTRLGRHLCGKRLIAQTGRSAGFLR